MHPRARSGAVAPDTWPVTTARFEPRVVLQLAGPGASQLVVQRDRSGHYVVPRTVNGVDVECLLDSGASDVTIPPALTRRLKLMRRPDVEFLRLPASSITRRH